MCEKTCHYPGCDAPLERYRWGCNDHWFALPIENRIDIHATELMGHPINDALQRADQVVALRLGTLPGWIRRDVLGLDLASGPDRTAYHTTEGN